MPKSARVLILLLTFCLAMPLAWAQQSKPSSGVGGWFAETWNSFFGGTRSAGEVNPNCTTCAKPKPQPRLPIDNSIEYLRGHVSCSNYEFLKSQRQALLDAERAYGIPATAVACLIATESSWNIHADQLNKRTGKYRGTFVGLVQAYQPAFDTIRNDIFTNPEFTRPWNAFLCPNGTSQAQMRSGACISPDILTRERMVAQQGFIPKCELEKCSGGCRCGGQVSPARRNQIARASIAFVSTYLKKNIGIASSRLREKNPADADRFLKTKYTQYMAAAIGYNAGEGTMFEYMPPEAFVHDGREWIDKIRKRKKSSVAKQGEVAQYVDYIQSCMAANPAIQPPERKAMLQDEACFGKSSPNNMRALLNVRRLPKAQCSNPYFVPTCPPGISQATPRADIVSRPDKPKKGDPPPFSCEEPKPPLKPNEKAPKICLQANSKLYSPLPASQSRVQPAPPKPSSRKSAKKPPIKKRRASKRT